MLVVTELKNKQNKLILNTENWAGC